MNTITTTIIEGFTQTLDTEIFINELQGLDSVSQRQCVLRALRSVGESAIVGLHGADAVRKAMKCLREVFDGKGLSKSPSL